MLMTGRHGLPWYVVISSSRSETKLTMSFQIFSLLTSAFLVACKSTIDR